MPREIVTTAVVLVAAFCIASCQEEHPAKFTVRLKDDTGKPVEGYTIHSGTLDYEASLRQGDPAKNDPVWTDVTTQTDARGEAVFEYKTLTGMVGINLSQGLTGNYYLTGIENYQFEKVKDGHWIPENPVIEAVIKRKLNPIPMYAKNMTPGGDGILKLKEARHEYLYDFEIGDWVPPDGNGKHGDIAFTYTMEKGSNGDYNRTIHVSFPSKGDGLIAFERDMRTGSTMASDHMAPVDGYQPSVELHRSSINGVIKDDAKPNANYYFRVRTKLDQDGKVISANYGKIYGDFMSFIYYFNPKPNDRNVEYDPERNLFAPKGGTSHRQPWAYQVTRP